MLVWLSLSQLDPPHARPAQVAGAQVLDAQELPVQPSPANLRNVPEVERPPQEALEVDFDPWKR